ncbi:MAG: RidA family protein [Halobacteria archaeon]|nr:RidA family protein [Halobacteria archaeon]
MKDIVSTDDAPEAVGAYSQATVANGFVFTAGQIPLTPEGEAVDGDVGEQTRQCLDNIQAVLEEAGAGLEDVVKVTVFLDDIDDFGEMNDVYSGYFDEEPPARSAVEAGSIPKGFDVEIEAVAALD